MPTYDYKCETCGVFERFQKISEANLSECPTCGSGVKKLFSPPGVVGMPNGPKNTAPTYRGDRSTVWNSAQAE